VFHHILAAILIGYAFYQGFSVTRNLSWPCEIDLIRNTAQAQSAIDSSLLDDPTYLGEKTWYSPLAHWIVALISSVSKIPPHIIFQRAGAFLNILVPVSFYIFIAILMEPAIALASLLGMLFVFNNHLPTCTSGTYTPILYSSHFAPWLFFITLLLYFKALKTGKSHMFLLTGVFLGLTFLAHNAPALIIGCIIFTITVKKIIAASSTESRKMKLKHFINFLLVTLFAAVAALPLLYPMLIHYKMNVLNERGTLYTLEFLRLDNISEFLKLFTPGLAVLFFVVLGGISLFKRAKKNEESRLLMLSFIIVILLFAYGYLPQLIGNLFYLPQLLPNFHYLVYIGFFEAILFGLGIYEFILIVLKAMRVVIKKKSAVKEKTKPLVENGVAFILFNLLLGVFFFSVRSDFLSRQDFTALRHPFCAKKHMKWYKELHDWVLTTLPPDTVFVNDENTPQEMLMTARKFVVHPVTPELSNPFVDYQKRLKDRDLMLLALEEGRYDVLLPLFDLYHAGYVISSLNTHTNYWDDPAFLKDVYNSQECTIFLIDYKILRKLASTGSHIKNHPYVLFNNQKMLSNAISYGIERRNFNYFENDELKEVLNGWRWIKKRNINTDMELMLKKMRKETLLVTTRKTAIHYLNSVSTKPEFIKGFYFCGFTLPRKILKIQHQNPQKVFIFHKDSVYYNFLASAEVKIYSLDNPYTILEEKYTDNLSFIQEACRMVLNCGMLELYALNWHHKIRRGNAERADIIRSLLKQTEEIDY